jgi:hypothetical protein
MLRSIMAIGKEVADAISVFEKLLARIEQGHVYTDEEYKAMSDLAHVIDLETSLYRLDDCVYCSRTTH